jgi:hypothetical protein
MYETTSHEDSEELNFYPSMTGSGSRRRQRRITEIRRGVELENSIGEEPSKEGPPTVRGGLGGLRKSDLCSGPLRVA